MHAVDSPGHAHPVRTGLRVLHVIPSIWPGSGGPAHAIRAIEAELVARGCEVVTATTDDDGPDCRLAAGEAAAETGASRQVFAMTTRGYKTSLGLWRYLRRHVAGFDVVHVHGLFSFAPLAAAWWARRRGVPYIVRPLGVLNHYGRLGRRRRLKALSMHWIEGPLLADASAVHFTAAQEQAEAQGCGVAMRTVVLPLGIAPVCEASTPAPPADGRWLLYMSRIHPKKNLEGCIAALAQLDGAHADLRLRVCGAGEEDYVAALKAHAAAHGVADRVVWAGPVAGQAKAQAFATASVFVLASHSENFGIAAAEALSCGLPCVLGHGVALAAEVEAAGAGVATDLSAAAIADAIRRLLADPAALAAHGRAARALWAERFSPQVMGERLLALYLDVAGAPARGVSA